MDAQRRAFEAQFGTLEEMGFSDATRHTEDGDSDSSEGPESTGSTSDSDSFASFSDSEGPRVVRLEDTAKTVVNRKDAKALRLGRAATLAELERKQKEMDKMSEQQRRKAAKEDSENLENDLKLQRLLSESHILAANMDYSGADLTLQTLDYEAPIGNARRRILDQRIKEVSAVNGSKRKLAKMSMRSRQEKIRARQAEAAQHEAEAKEAGIILARVKKGQFRNLDRGLGATNVEDRVGTLFKVKKEKRARGLKIQSVGRSTKNGLVISQRDIDRINRR